MIKEHILQYLIIDNIEIKYFYKREKRDINGNSRFRVYIIDPDAPAVYETIFKCYESQIPELIKTFIERDGE
jgi:hypothetical protein